MYWTGAHTKHRLTYHIVCVPKYRKCILEGALAQRIKELFYECVEVNGWEIKEINVQIDHVHTLIQLTPSVSVSQVVQYLKGGSSRILRQEFPDLKLFLWGDSFWGDGYFAETYGQVNEEVILEYVRNQAYSP